MQKRIGQLCWILADKSVLKGFTLEKHAGIAKCSNTCERQEGQYISFFHVLLEFLDSRFFIVSIPWMLCEEIANKWSKAQNDIIFTILSGKYGANVNVKVPS